VCTLSFVSEESLAHRVCLLLIELQLCMYQPDKTLALIAYIENQFVVSTDSVISSEKDVKPLEKEHKEKKVHRISQDGVPVPLVHQLGYRLNDRNQLLIPGCSDNFPFLQRIQNNPAVHPAPPT